MDDRDPSELRTAISEAKERRRRDQLILLNGIALGFVFGLVGIGGIQWLMS